MQSPVGMGLTSLDLGRRGPAHRSQRCAVHDPRPDPRGAAVRPLEDFTHPEDRGRSSELKRRTPATARSPRSTSEKRYIRGDGAVVWAALRGSLSATPAAAAPGSATRRHLRPHRPRRWPAPPRAARLLTELPNRSSSSTGSSTRCPAPRAGRLVGRPLRRRRRPQDGQRRARPRARATPLIVELGRRFSRRSGPGRQRRPASRGDEFTVLVAAPDAVTRADVAERLLESLQQPVPVGGATVPSAASIGVAFASRARDRPTRCSPTPTPRCWRPSAPGKERVAALRRPACTPRRATAEPARPSCEPAAAEGQFELHYQPIVDARDRRASSAVEALVRWQHPGTA